MATRRKTSKPKASSRVRKSQHRGFSATVVAPSFLCGLAIGLVIPIAYFYFGSRNIITDNELLQTFPSIEKVFPNTRFEFPDRLETTDPDRVGQVRPEGPTTAQVDDTIEQNDQSVADPTQNEPESTVDVEVAASEHAEPEPPSATDRSITGYVLQAGAFGEKRHADAFRASLLMDGYNAYTTRIQSADSSVQFRVIVGPYDSVEATMVDAERLEERNVSTFVVTMREGTP